MIRKITLFIIASLLLLPLGVTNVAAKRISLDITSAEARKIIFAVPWFQSGGSDSDAKLDRTLADTLSKVTGHPHISVHLNSAVIGKTRPGFLEVPCCHTPSHNGGR